MSRQPNARAPGCQHPVLAEKMEPRRVRTEWLIVAVLLAALAVRLITAAFLRQPGYADAYYYSNLAGSLQRGEGFVDYVIWNYLDAPRAIPQPACLYWMPLTACVIYPFYLLFGVSFAVAQLPFVMLSTVLVWITYRVSIELSGRRDQALLAAVLVTFSGFYTVFWVTTDSFALFAVVCSLALYAAGRGLRSGGAGWFALSGGCAALAHLTRADGALVLVAVCVAVAAWGVGGRVHRRPALRGLALTIIVYLAVMAPWLVRNWQVVGSPLGSGGLQTLFLRDYDELYSYGRELTLSHYLAWGWKAILGSKLQATWFALQNLVAVNLMIFLTPLAVWGLLVWRKRTELLPFAAYAVILYITMTLLFTFPGMRGGLFHSSAALLPWLFAAAACGLRRFVQFMARRRPNWTEASAFKFFAVASACLALAMSGFLYLRSVRGQPGVTPPWQDRNLVYRDIGAWIHSQGAAARPVMVNDAPAFYYFTQLPAVSIPNEEPDVVVQAAHHFGVGYLVLEADHPQPLRDVYDGRAIDPRLDKIETLAGPAGAAVQVWRVEPER